MKLQNKVAIITGAAQGMGAMHARKFVEEGAKVVITDINLEAAQKLADELGENAIALKLDVSNADNWKEVVEKTEEKFGPVTVLVNNAGVAPKARKDDCCTGLCPAASRSSIPLPSAGSQTSTCTS